MTYSPEGGAKPATYNPRLSKRSTGVEQPESDEFLWKGRPFGRSDWIERILASPRADREQAGRLGPTLAAFAGVLQNPYREGSERYALQNIRE